MIYYELLKRGLPGKDHQMSTNAFVDALWEFKRAYDSWDRGGRRWKEPTAAEHGVSRYEAQQLRAGHDPIEIFQAMHFSIKKSYAARSRDRGPAEDPRKKVKHTTRKHTAPTPKRLRRRPW